MHTGGMLAWSVPLHSDDCNKCSVKSLGMCIVMAFNVLAMFMYLAILICAMLLVAYISYSTYHTLQSSSVESEVVAHYRP